MSPFLVPVKTQDVYLGDNDKEFSETPHILPMESIFSQSWHGSMYATIAAMRWIVLILIPRSEKLRHMLHG
jgi:hypothetical protein